MGKAFNGRFRKGKSDGLLRKVFSKPLREQYCEACGRPHVEQDEPPYIGRFWLGNAEIQVFESKQYGRRVHEFKVQRWVRYPHGWYPQSVFSLEDLGHLASVVGQALRIMYKSQHSPKNGKPN